MTKTAIRFEPAAQSDANALADLRAEAMRPSLEAIGRFDPDRARRRFLNGFSALDTTVLRVRGDIAGLYVLLPRETEIWLDHLYIARPFQGQGLGHAVIARAKARARAVGLPLRLLALDGSASAAFYQGCGFVAGSSDGIDTLFEWGPVPV